MTRPFGRSPARSKLQRPQDKLEEISLIDVGVEDDNLLPSKSGTPKGNFGSASFSRPGASPFKTSGGRHLESIQEDQPDGGVLDEEDEQLELPPLLSVQGPTPNKKKKKSGFNLRKSLAWNNAFFTEEGVLDPEELALVNGTFKKTPETPKPGSHKKPALASKILNSTGIPKIKFSPVRSQKNLMQVDNKQIGPTVHSPLRSVGGTISKQAEVGKGFSASRSIVPTKVPQDPVKGGRSMVSTRTEALERKKSSLLSKQQYDATSRNTNVSPQSLNNGKSLKTVPELSNIHALTNTFSFASKKMKDKLGMVFSGFGMGSSKLDTISMPKDDSAVPSPTLLSQVYAENAKLTRCYSQLSSTHEKFGRAISPKTHNRSIQSAANMAMESPLGDVRSESCLNQEINRVDPSGSCCQNPAVTDSSVCPVAKETTSQSLSTRLKPSGLRMPSPKLGFFDKARPTSAAQAVNYGMKYGKITGYVPECVDINSGITKQNGTAIQTGRYTTNIPLPENSTLGKQNNAKPPLYSTSKLEQQQSEMVGRNKGVKVSTATTYQSSAIVSVQIPSTAFSAAPTNVSCPETAAAVGACRTLLKNQGPNVISNHTSSQSHGLSSSATAKSKTFQVNSRTESDDTGNVLQAKKNSLNVPPAVKKGITALSVPARNATGQENARSVCAQEPSSQACGDCKQSHDSDAEVWPEVKSGAVQHSPPNKEPPKPGPWSPIKRNGQELGPFDCTKYTNLGVTQF